MVPGVTPNNVVAVQAAAGTNGPIGKNSKKKTYTLLQAAVLQVM
jgi:hypothetical protein